MRFYKRGKYTIIKWYGGDIWWELNDERHREEGPAVEYQDGKKAWYLEGEKYTEEDWKQEMRKRKLAVLGI